jgi:hypothetical protein
MSPEQIQSLLRERAGAQMPQNYEEKLIQELRDRQRAEFLRQPAWRIAAERLGTFLSEHSLSTPRYALCLAALVAVCVGVIALLKPNAGSGVMAKQERNPRAEEAFRPGVEARHVSYEK